METQEPNVIPTTRSVGLRYGLIMALISIAYFVALNVAGIDMTQGWGRWSGLLFNAVVIVLAHKYFKDNGNGFMGYGKGLEIGFWIALISSILGSLFTYVYAKFIDLNFMEMIADKQREAMEARHMSEDQINAAMEMAAKFSTPEMLLLFGVIMGFISILFVALIVTIFTQKRDPNIPI